jgi:NTP pyrophosphatase (non-canonical NTP hydrolase)
MKIMVNETQITEVMDILQEECAEVIQAVSKIRRFGYDSRWPEEGPNNRQLLEMEIGDLLAMVDILVERCVISDSNINDARAKKKEKLKIWTKIYDTTGTN